MSTAVSMPTGGVAVAENVLNQEAATVASLPIGGAATAANALNQEAATVASLPTEGTAVTVPRAVDAAYVPTQAVASAAHMSNRGVASLPRVSNRVLAELKKGAKVALWVTCTPYKIGTDRGTNYKSEYILDKAHKSLIRHFSPRWDRELAADEHADRVHVPFCREPVKLVVGWMMAGGGNHIGTMAVPYPIYHRENLEILKGLAVYLEIKPLIERVTNDIAAIEPILPKAPTAKAAPKEQKPSPPKICWYCNKAGHFKKDCAERFAVHVTMSTAETYDKNGRLLKSYSGDPAQSMAEEAVTVKSASPAAETSHPKQSTAEPLAGKAVATKASGPAAAMIQKPLHPERSKAEAAAGKAVATKTTSPSAGTSAGPSKQKLRPVSGGIVVVDTAGKRYVLDWDRVEIEMEPVTGNSCKITGSLRVAP